MLEFDAAGRSSPWQLFWRRVPRDRPAMASLVFIALLILIAVLAPVLVDLLGVPDPNERDQAALDPFYATATGPSSATGFGVDQIGRDVFSRTIYGARVSLCGDLGDRHTTALGIVAGLLSGYFRGWTDTLISRGVDVLLAVPCLLLATGLATACTAAVTGGSGSTGCLGGLVNLAWAS